MTPSTNLGRIAGLLFLVALIPYVIAQMAILENMLYAQDYVSELNGGRTKVGIALILTYISLTAMLGFSILIFPILRKYGNELAVGYVGLRFIEFGILFLGTIKLMTLVSLSQSDLGAGPLILESILREWKWIGFLYMFPFALHNFVFYHLLLKSALIPKSLSIAGIIATALILVNILLTLLDLSYGGFFLFAPIGFVELGLGTWLLLFGFNDSP